jgi:histidinol-phosphate aminotransferase
LKFANKRYIKQLQNSKLIMSKNFNINNTIRENVKRLKPYSCARDEFSGVASVYLDANENSLGSIGTDHRNRYPDPHQSSLKSALAELNHIAPDKIFLGNGSDEAIDLIFRAFCNPGIDKVILLPPTYGMYEVSANINDISIIKVPLTKDFQLNVPEILKCSDKNTKLVFICSPNNPTANCMNDNDIKEILDNFQGIVVIDEAYIDFANRKSWIDRLDEYPNLIVLQTFSKAWGLANIRLGIAYAQTNIVEVLTKIKPPYNVNGITQEFGLKALLQTEQKEKAVATLLSERIKLIDNLKQFDFITHIYPSDANFILVKTSDARKMYNYLISKNIIVRDRSNQTNCENCIRITVGTPEENNVLIETLQKFE